MKNIGEAKRNKVTRVNIGVKRSVEAKRGRRTLRTQTNKTNILTMELEKNG